MMSLSEKRHYLRELNHIKIYVLDENAYSIVVSSSLVSPKSRVSIRLTKITDENGIYVMFRNKKVYEIDWNRI